MAIINPTPIPKAVLGVMGITRNIKVQDGESWIMVERLIWPDGTPFDRDVTGAYGVVDVSIRVFHADGEDTSTAIYAPSNLTVASVLFDQPYQTGNYWTIDSTGYNFLYILPYSFADVEGGRRYRVEFIFNPHASNPFGPKLLTFMVTIDEAVGV